MPVPGKTTQTKRQAARLRLAIVAGVLLTAAAADVHTQERCVFLCAPDLIIEPTLTIENTFGPAKLEQVEDGMVLGTMRQEREKVFELVLAVGIPTEIPRVGFTFETIFSPFRHDTESSWSSSSTSPGSSQSRPEVGWKVTSTSSTNQPAERPTDTSAYTHKLKHRAGYGGAHLQLVGRGQLGPKSRSRGVA